MLLKKLRCIPSNYFPKWLGDFRRVHSLVLTEYHAIAIPTDELHFRMETEKKIQTLDCQRPGKYIATNNDLIDIELAHFRPHGFERGEITVNVVKGCYSHAAYRRQSAQHERKFKRHTRDGNMENDIACFRIGLEVQESGNGLARSESSHR